MPRHRPRRRRHVIVALGVALVASLVATLPATQSPQVGDALGAIATPVATSPPNDPRAASLLSTSATGRRTAVDRSAPDPATLTGYTWPLAKGRITLPFKAIPGGSRIKDGKLFHDGLDMATFCGDRVLAAHDGVVLAAGRRFDEHIGWVGDLAPYYAVLDERKLWDDLPIVVVVDDGNGYRSIYAHFSKVSVAPGDRVTAGQEIGREGATGHASGCHVHYGLFSTHETATFGVREDILKRLRLPELEIARVDPILVMPDGEAALEARRFPVPAPAVEPPAWPERPGGIQ